MRTAIFTSTFLLAGMLSAQSLFTPDDFEAQVLAYAPERHQGVSDKSFEFGKMVFRETVRQTDNDPEEFNRGDYYNILTGMVSLREPEENIRLAWQKFVAAEGSCDYLTDAGIEKSLLKGAAPGFLRTNWAKAKAKCLTSEEKTATPPTPEAYASEHKLDVDLIKLISQISDDDQRFRKDNYDQTKQVLLDQQNVQLIDQLYEQYSTYLGTSLVGEAYNFVMWSVIQHSTAETMERYLPVVHDAVQNGELSETPLRMLIDRVQTNRTGKQVFGSQAGVPLLPKATRTKIAKQYDID